MQRNPLLSHRYGFNTRVAPHACGGGDERMHRRGHPANQSGDARRAERHPAGGAQYRWHPAQVEGAMGQAERAAPVLCEILSSAADALTRSEAMSAATTAQCQISAHLIASVDQAAGGCVVVVGFRWWVDAWHDPSRPGLADGHHIPAQQQMIRPGGRRCLLSMVNKYL